MLIFFDTCLEVQAELAGVGGRLHGDADSVEVHEVALEEVQRLEAEEHVVNREEIVPLTFQPPLQPHYKEYYKEYYVLIVRGYQGLQ